MMAVPKVTSYMQEKMNMLLVNFCIRNLSNLIARKSSKSFQRGRGTDRDHANRKFERSLNMIITIKDGTESSTAAKLQRWKTFSKRKKADWWRLPFYRLKELSDWDKISPSPEPMESIYAMTPYKGGQGSCIWPASVRDKHAWRQYKRFISKLT